jgi:deazaflavin-dependent oxidoreductase (nitroreductase family)
MTERIDHGSVLSRRPRVVLVQRFLLNPPTKLITWLGLLPGHTLLETTGRRTGKRRRVVVGTRIDRDRLWIVAEQGTHAGYVRNLSSNPHVRVRIGRRWVAGTAQVVADDDVESRLDGFGMPMHARNVRRFGTELCTIRADLDPADRART